MVKPFLGMLLLLLLLLLLLALASCRERSPSMDCRRFESLDFSELQVTPVIERRELILGFRRDVAQDNQPLRRSDISVTARIDGVDRGIEINGRMDQLLEFSMAMSNYSELKAPFTISPDRVQRLTITIRGITKYSY